jgi:hypothetical protein
MEHLSATKDIHLTISIKRHLREIKLSMAVNDRGSPYPQICETQRILA